MRNLVLAAALLFPLAARAQGADSTLVPLDSVIMQVQRVLDRYQHSLGDSANPLPPLKSAVFTFKTTASKSTGFSINLLIFTLGSAKESDVVSTVQFTYAVAKPLRGAKWRGNASLEDQLYATIVSAARAVASGAGGVGTLALKQFEVSIAFGVQRNRDAGARAQISIVTAGLKGGKDDNSVQSLDLTFSY